MGENVQKRWTYIKLPILNYIQIFAKGTNGINHSVLLQNEGCPSKRRTVGKYAIILRAL